MSQGNHNQWKILNPHFDDLLHSLCQIWAPAGEKDGQLVIRNDKNADIYDSLENTLPKMNQVDNYQIASRRELNFHSYADGALVYYETFCPVPSSLNGTVS